MDSNIDTNASGFAADPQRNTNGNNTNRLYTERNLVHVFTVFEKHVI